MSRTSWIVSWRSVLAIAAIAAIGGPLPSTFPASATPLASSARSLRPIAHPPLPPLGAPDLFLPLSDEQTVRLEIRLSERRVYVYDREQVVTSYPIAIGRSGWETPTGTFKVMQMLHDPAWEHPFTGEVVPPGAGNPLGSRWIGFWTDGVNYIGFHGTPNAETVGQAASHGCIRMYDNDVKALFETVQVGTPVVVLP
jgi:L,D-transpeptidase ErfK/SrfK